MIQEVQLKKPNKHGEYRELEVYQESWSMGGKPARWSYRYTGGHFERPHLEAYKISIHESYRDHGQIRKRQYSVATMSYYDVIEYSLYDCASSRIEALSKLIDMGELELYDLIESKLTPLRERLEADYHQSEEYRTRQEHKRIMAGHLEARSEFCKQYEVDSDEYDRCYDVFGKLRNEAYLKQIVRRHRESRRSYQRTNSGNYSWAGSCSYGVSAPSTYTDSETAILKQFYRSLSKSYHPDLNPGKDTTAEMQLLNKLKEAWGV